MNRIQHLVVIGTGLIGGSLSLALKKAGMVERVTGVGRNRANLELAQERSIVDDWTHDIAAAVVDADMVLVAVPMAAYEAVFAAMADALPATAIVSDAGSTKQSALLAVEAMWQCVGSRVMSMSPLEHDEFLAAVSHLPHLTAFALVNAVRKQASDGHDPFEFAAGGFRDFTRIASSSPQMWRDIAMCNREAVLHQVDALQDELNVLKQALLREDSEALLENFTSAKQARDAWLATYGKSL